jgi:hypothetical protein
MEEGLNFRWIGRNSIVMGIECFNKAVVNLAIEESNRFFVRILQLLRNNLFGEMSTWLRTGTL